MKCTVPSSILTVLLAVSLISGISPTQAHAIALRAGPTTQQYCTTGATGISVCVTVNCPNHFVDNPLPVGPRVICRDFKQLTCPAHYDSGAECVEKLLSALDVFSQRHCDLVSATIDGVPVDPHSVNLETEFIIACYDGQYNDPA